MGWNLVTWPHPPITETWKINKGTELGNSFGRNGYFVTWEGENRCWGEFLVSSAILTSFSFF